MKARWVSVKRADGGVGGVGVGSGAGAGEGIAPESMPLKMLPGLGVVLTVPSCESARPRWGVVGGGMDAGEGLLSESMPLEAPR